MRRGQRAAIAWSWVMTTIVAPAGVELLDQGHDRAAGRAVSRLPVGSSASTIAGRPTSARAIATRCRSPPDSCVGRAPAGAPSPTPASASAARPRRSRAGDAGVEQPVGDVVERARVLGEEELLEDEPDPGRPQRGELAVAQLGDVEAGDRAPSRCVGRSSVPIRCSSVDLPDPDGPTIATSSPAPTAKLTPSQRRHRRLAAVALRHLVELQHRRRCAHEAGTTTRWPAARPAAGHLHEPVRRRRRSPASTAHQPVDAVGVDLSTA